MKRIRNANFVTSLFGVRGAPMQYYFLLQMILFQSTKPLVWIISRIMLKGSSIYYVTTFWGIFEPPPSLTPNVTRPRTPPPLQGYSAKFRSGYTLENKWLHAPRRPKKYWVHAHV